MKPPIQIALLAVLALALAACNSTPAPTATSARSTPSPYPAGPGTVYPPPQVTASPAAPCTETPLMFDTRPLAAGATTVTGTGPAGLPITLDSVMNMGRQLGSGTIGADGHFAIGVAPLEAGDFVGLRLGDLTGTGFTLEMFQGNRCYHGPERMLVPQVGFFFDTTVVK